MNKKSKLIGLILTFAVVGCDLEVNNPNSLLEDDLKDPSAASAVAKKFLSHLEFFTSFILSSASSCFSVVNKYNASIASAAKPLNCSTIFCDGGEHRSL